MSGAILGPTHPETPSSICLLACMHEGFIRSRIPEFDIEPDIALELLMAANFLDC